MGAIDNGVAGHLVIAGVHDGPCGIRAGAGVTTVAFHWARTGERPERAVGGAALLDGVGWQVRSVARSTISEGFYLATLEPAAVAGAGDATSAA